MTRHHSQAFKKQAVKKVLLRAKNVTAQAIANELGVSSSTLYSWISKMGRNGEEKQMTKEKKPTDWTLEERLDMIISCAALKDEDLSTLCRQNGIFSHHIKQWKQGFLVDKEPVSSSKDRVKDLTSENKSLKKELRRKDKALAETAALLVLQKKVHEIWGTDEDSS
jgi:transposase